MQLQTYLFVPGANQKLIQKALSSAADVVSVDLEDAVAQKEKEKARQLLYQASRLARQENKQIMVRINGVDSEEWEKDLQVVLKNDVKSIMLPKVESSMDIKQVTSVIEESGVKKFTLVPLIESAKGVLNAFDIATSHSFIKRLAFGSVDYALDIGAETTTEEDELLFARSQLINASAAAKLAGPIDSPFIDFTNENGFITSTKRAKKLGMQAKLLIHPKQIELFESVYQPSLQELEENNCVIKRFEEALAKGIASISYKGRMVDYPVYKKAKSLQAKYPNRNRSNDEQQQGEQEG